MAASYIRRGIAFASDLCVCILLTISWQLIWMPPFGLCTMDFILVTIGLYFPVCQLIFKRSMFQYLLGLKLSGKGWNYCLVKTTLVVLVPLLLSRFHTLLVQYLWNRDLVDSGWELFCGSKDWLQKNNAILICSLAWLIPLWLADFLTWIFKRKSIFDMTGTCVVEYNSDKTSKVIHLLLILLFFILLLYKPIQKKRLCKIHFPTAYNVTPHFPPIPLREQLKLAHSFKENAKTPEKIMDEMFQKFDIVVFVERYHPETTQWDFLSNYIASEKFAEKVGFLSTEYGRLEQQKELDCFMHTKYETDSQAQIAAAKITRSCISWWPVFPNRNLFDFLIKMNQFNSSHDSSKQIKWDFTNHNSFLEYSEDILGAQKKVDSIMGTNIVEQYRRQLAHNPDKKKRLVILNHFHGYRNIKHEKMAIDYIEEAFSGKVGVVALPSENICTFSFSLPTDMGLWDEAAKRCGYPFGVFVDESILNEMCYNGWCAPDKRGKIKINKLFDAVIFLNHPYQFCWDENGYPYIFKDYEEEFTLKCKNGHLEHFINILEEYKQNGGRINQRKNPAIVWKYNRIYDTMYYLILLIPLLSLIVWNLKMTICQKKE